MRRKSGFSQVALFAVAALSLAFMACPSPVGPGGDPPPLEPADLPGFSVPSGELEPSDLPLTILITCETEGATFRYTTDGTDPSSDSPEGASVEISGPTILRVVASAPSRSDSAIAEAVYTVRVEDTDATLSSLGYAKGILSPPFDPDVFAYTLTVPVGLSSVPLSPVALSARASVDVGGLSSGTGTASAELPVSDGASFVVGTRSESGTETREYSITIRAIDFDAWSPGSVADPDFDDFQWKLALSADGSTLFAVPELGGELAVYPWKSTDDGATWTELKSAGNRIWDWIRCDADGSVVVAESDDYPVDTISLHISLDGGATWRAPYVVNSSSTTYLALSDDGAKMYLKAHLQSAQGAYSATDEVLFASADSGASWTAVLDMSQEESGAETEAFQDDLLYPHVATSSDGSVVVVGGASTFDYGGLFVSLDSGATWTERYYGASFPVDDLSLSGDASKLAIVSIFDVELSTNLGETWSTAEEPYISGETYSISQIAWSLDASTLLGVVDRSYSSEPDSAIFASTNSGATWSLRFQNPAFGLSYSWAASDDASSIAVFLNHGIQLTTDSGATWRHLQNMGRTSWSAFGMSRDGVHQVAAASSGFGDSTRVSAGTLFLSSDSGDSWERAGFSGEKTWLAADVSDDGQTLAAVYWEESKFKVVVSRDSGFSWNAPISLSGYTSAIGLELSADGETMLLTYPSGNYTYLSTNGGASWSTIPALGTKSIDGSSLSADGQTITLVGPYNVWASRDGGATWTTKSAEIYGQLVDVSDDGRVMVSADLTGRVRLSLDGGSSWTTRTLPGSNGSAEDANKAIAAAVSADGRGIAVATGRAVYTSMPPFATEEGSILLSVDGGATWSRLSGAATAAWTGIAATDDFSLIVARAREMPAAPLVVGE